MEQLFIAFILGGVIALAFVAFVFEIVNDKLGNPSGCKSSRDKGTIDIEIHLQENIYRVSIPKPIVIREKKEEGGSDQDAEKQK